LDGSQSMVLYEVLVCPVDTTEKTPVSYITVPTVLRIALEVEVLQSQLQIYFLISLPIEFFLESTLFL
jgi:hypothetical protein